MTIKRKNQIVSQKRKLCEGYIREFRTISTDWERQNLTGIVYRILNLKNGKSYIGQTIFWFNCRYIAGKWWKYSKNKILKRAAIKYGIENFKIEILEFGIESLDKLNELEIKYIAEYKSFIDDGCGYNLTRGGFSNEVSEETRKLMSGENHPQFGKTGDKSIWFGRKHSQETKDKISKSHSGENSVWFGKKHPQETKEKMSKAQSGKKKTPEHIAKIGICNRKPVKQLDKETGELLKLWPSVREAERNLSIHHVGIGNVCSGKSKTAGGFRWEY